MSPIVTVPTPPAFLDPLTQIESCYYYAVPKFFGQNHPNTRWLITMIKNSEEDRLKHKMEINPGAFKGAYYQLIDNPQLHTPEDVAATPMFKRQAVVYLSILGMAIYLGNVSMVELLLTYKDTYDECLCDPCEPQYATHLQDNEIGDFHSFPPFIIMLRRSCFGCAQELMKAGWDPKKSVAMPMRRKFERRVLYFRDWLEVALSVLAARPMYSLPSLIREMTKGPHYTPVQMPLHQLLPPNPAEAEPVGLINVDQLPDGIEMMGVRSLLDMAEHYDRYLQMRQCAKQVTALKREASAVGLNPEVLMIQAQDFDGGVMDPPEQTDGSNLHRDANNSSVVEDSADGRGQQPRHVLLNVNTSASKPKANLDPAFASEGCRILHFALMRDPHGKSMQVCMEAFCVLLNRGFYLIAEKPNPLSSKSRDVYNTAALMLNLVQREQGKVDKIVDKIKSGVKRFAHLEEHKQLENRKTACILYMGKLVGVLTKLLLQTKILVSFIQSDFPPFSPYVSNIVLNPYLAQKFQEIKFGVIREFNSRKDAWVYLDNDMLRTVSNITEMQLHFKVGKVPTKPQKGENKGKGGNKNKSNMSNTNSCFVSYTRVQRRPKPTVGSRMSAAAAAAAAAAATTATISAISSVTAASSPPPISGDVNSEADLLMDSSADDISVDTCYPPELPELSDLVATTNVCDPRQEHPEPTGAAVELTGAISGTSAKEPNMEQLLANLCREVDSLFRPLENDINPALSEANLERAPTTAGGTAAAGSASAGGVSEAAASRMEHSTIEPELASTPMPTPGPSPASTHVKTSEQEREQRRRRRPLHPALRKKLKQSGVLRLLNQ